MVISFLETAIGEEYVTILCNAISVSGRHQRKLLVGSKGTIVPYLTGQLTSQVAPQKLFSMLTAVQDLLEIDEFTGETEAQDMLERAGCFDMIEALIGDS